MALSIYEQLNKYIDDARHILIALRQDAGGDAIASAVALALFLEKRAKQTEIAAYDFALPKKFSFLEKATTIQSRLPHLQKFLISIDVSTAGVQELSYDVKDQKLHIFVTPKTGYLTKEQMTTAQSEFRYDLIIVLDAPDLDALGPLYEHNKDLFQRVPIINLDHSAENEHFGEINHVQITASSTAEVVAHTIMAIDQEAVSEDIATALLTGMIANTHSFKTEHIKPQSLSLASTLVSLGADRDFIVKHLYQTKTLSMLRLWGQALSRINYDQELKLVSTTITREDFSRSGATEEELYDIIDELIVNSPEEELSLLLHEHVNGAGQQLIHGILNVEKPYNAKELLKEYHPTGDTHQVSITLKGSSLQQAEHELITHLRQKVQAMRP